MLGGGVASLEEEEVEEEVQELGHAETYNEYMPVKCKNPQMKNNITKYSYLNVFLLGYSLRVVSDKIF